MAPEQLGGKPEAPEITCDNCVAACCRAGFSAQFTDLEASDFRRDTPLYAHTKPKPYKQDIPVTKIELDRNGHPALFQDTMSVPKHHGMYVFLTNCGRLGEPATEGQENRLCGQYETRPTACRNFAAGSPACLSIRAQFGLDGHEAIKPLVRDEPIRFVNRRQVN